MIANVLKLLSLSKAAVSQRPQAAVTSPISNSDFTRKNRWKRRGSLDAGRKVYRFAALGVCSMIGLGLLLWFALPKPVDKSLDGPFGQALVKAFPEADTRQITLTYSEIDGDEHPAAAMLYLPAHLLASEKVADPFERLASEFGGRKKILSGAELGQRIEQIVSTVLPDEITRCQTYDIGEASRGGAVKTRALHLHLNPGC